MKIFVFFSLAFWLFSAPIDAESGFFNRDKDNYSSNEDAEAIANTLANCQVRILILKSNKITHLF